MLRYILAFLAAPIPAAIISAALVALRPIAGGGIREHPASMFISICLLFYFLGVVIGVPLFLLMRRRDASDLRAHALAGMAIGMAPALIVLGWSIMHRPVGVRYLIVDLLYFAVNGLLAGALFWLIARPDRRAKRKAIARSDRLSATFD